MSAEHQNLGGLTYEARLPACQQAGGRGVAGLQGEHTIQHNQEVLLLLHPV
jgi:hypothetical protein